MAQTVRFVDGIAYTEADQSDFNLKMMRPQGVLPESALGTLVVSAIGSMNVRVGPGEAHVQGFQYRNDANVDLNITANGSGSTRVDVVILSLNRAANTLLLSVVVGTPGAGAPTLTQVEGGNWQFPIANVSVPNNATSITGGDLTDRRVYSQWSAVTIVPAIVTDAEMAAAIAVETSARGTAVTNEANARIAADNTLQANINTVSNDRATGDTSLTNSINAEITNRANADSAEATARANADTTLQNNINAEATTRSNADSTEATARANADTAEATNRTNADNALSARITTLENLKVVAAAIYNPTGDGWPLLFEGISSGNSRTGVGSYTVNFSPALAGNPTSIVVCGHGGASVFVTATFFSYSASQVFVETWNAAGAKIDAGFSITVAI